MMSNLKCADCGEDKEGNFYPRNHLRCKTCLIKRARIYQREHPEQMRQYEANKRAKPGYKEKHAEYYKKWYAEHGRNRTDNYASLIYLWQKEHTGATKVARIVRQAIKDGLLERPLKCSLCGRDGRINGHHEDYNSPYEVLWVCSSCHKKIHLGLIG